MQLLLQDKSLRLVTDHGEARPMRGTKRAQLGQPCETGKRENGITIRVTRDDIQRAQPDRPGRTKNGYL
ncbi:hypothetical protein B597_010315 [Stutzerimonas stutzeri KOS6]|uniref:Uncharacterized protein n=1 Tax=Stutzerimonas stutzeri KOS6 TaxID=1218352 RepID=A0A061JNL7_STUST|nr:hypothetical protein B597_010315 [Stutzerimonas stutzeri KOS6]